MNQKQILKQLEKVPSDTKETNIVNAGEVLSCEVIDKKIFIETRVGSPAMHTKKKREADIIACLKKEQKRGYEINVHVKADATSHRQDSGKVMPNIKNIIAIASGKGGVGKSTITANLAVALSKMQAKVGLIDADIYGPSIPLMLDVQKVRPKMIEVGNKKLIEPVENYGVKMLSIGFFADPNQAVAWRGPMATKALRQMFADAHWGDLDYLLIDLPPGTGDVHLTLVESIPVTGSIIVGTPQNVALADVRKGVAMFRMNNINIPILGLVENMAWFTPSEMPESKYYLFGKDGVKNLSKELDAPLLAQIPLVQSLREAADNGSPATLDDSHPAVKYFQELVENMLIQLDNLHQKKETVTDK